ncbi:Uma2 family endonuclease [Streptomyces sp. WAC01280]|nr:Uma2 family endonuclease [Streptomyces sp. WAC01280]
MARGGPRPTPGSPRRTRLIDKYLTFTLWPKRAWHGRLITSPESTHRDRTIKLRTYAAAGIPHCWRVEREAESPVVHVLEVDAPNRTHALAGISRGTLQHPVPCEIALGLNRLAAQAAESRHAVSTDAQKQPRPAVTSLADHENVDRARDTMLS